MDLRCIWEVKMIGIPDELDVGSRDQRKVKDDYGIFALKNYMNYILLSEGGWTGIK